MTNKYTLHCKLPEDYGDKLDSIAEETGLSKVVIVQQALNSHFKAYDAQKKLMDTLASDPVKVAEISKMLGLA